MNEKRFIKYLAIQIILIPWIVMVFKFITERQVAAVVAGSSFILTTGWILFTEFRQAKRSLPVLAAQGFFFCAFCLPIFLLRLANWGQDFDSLQLFGIPAKLMHDYSTYAMMLAMAVTAIEWFRARSKRTA